MKKGISRNPAKASRKEEGIARFDLLQEQDDPTKFILVEDRVLAQVHLPAWPFVPEHLRSMLTGMSAKIDDIGNTRFADASITIPLLRPVLMVVLVTTIISVLCPIVSACPARYCVTAMAPLSIAVRI